MIDANNRSALRLCAAPGCSKTYRPGVSGPVARTHSETCSRRLRRHEARGRGRLHMVAEHMLSPHLDEGADPVALGAELLASGEPLARLEEFLDLWTDAHEDLNEDGPLRRLIGGGYVESDGSVTDLAELMTRPPVESGGRSTSTESGEDGDGPAGRLDVRPGRRAVGERLDFGELHPDLADGLSFEGDGDPGRCPCLDCPHDPACPCAPELARPAEDRGACVHDPYCPCAARFCSHERPLDPRRGSYWEDHGETCPEFR